MSKEVKRIVSPINGWLLVEQNVSAYFSQNLICTLDWCKRYKLYRWSLKRSSTV